MIQELRKSLVTKRHIQLVHFLNNHRCRRSTGFHYSDGFAAGVG